MAYHETVLFYGSTSPTLERGRGSRCRPALADDLPLLGVRAPRDPAGCVDVLPRVTLHMTFTGSDRAPWVRDSSVCPRGAKGVQPQQLRRGAPQDRGQGGWEALGRRHPGDRRR